MATAFPVRAQTALRALSRDIPMRRSEPYPPSSHLAKFSTSTPSRVWGSCLVRVMRIFGNASPMDRIGAISLSSVECADMSLTYTFLPGFEIWKAVCARMRRGAIPVVPCQQRCRGTFVHAAMRASEMKNSPSGSHGRAGARISNLPPRLSLLCMVVYIKEEPAMQISMLALLGSRTGEARASCGTAPSNRHIQGMTRLDRCAGQDAEAGRPPIGMRVRMLQRDSSCRIRLLCGCRKTCWQHSYYPNDIRIPWDRLRLTRAIFSASSASSAGASSTRNSPGGSPMQPKIQKESNGQRGLPFPMVDS